MVDLLDVLQGLLDKADRYRDKGINEADTKALLIEPMLGALGWDLHDLEAVTREYRVYDGTLIDYALKVGNEPRLFVEAKPMARSLDDKQLIAKTVNYANNEGVVWCVLTNGLQYRVYKSNEPVEMEQKLLFKVDVEDSRNEAGAENVNRLLSYLARESVESGQVDEWGEATFTDVRVKSALDALLTDPPTPLVKLVSQRVGAGVPLPPGKVRDSLRRMAKLLGIHRAVLHVAPPSPSLPTPLTPHVGWKPLDQLTVSSNQSPPGQIRLPDGTIRPLNAWRDLLVEVTRYLATTGGLGAQHCPVQKPGARARFVLHTTNKHPSGKEFFQPEQIDSLWLETNLSAKALHDSALYLIRLAGQSASGFHVL